mgnify:FL=1
MREIGQHGLSMPIGADKFRPCECWDENPSEGINGLPGKDENGKPIFYPIRGASNAISSLTEHRDAYRSTL